MPDDDDEIDVEAETDGDDDDDDDERLHPLAATPIKTTAMACRIRQRYDRGGTSDHSDAERKDCTPVHPEKLTRARKNALRVSKVDATNQSFDPARKLSRTLTGSGAGPGFVRGRHFLRWIAGVHAGGRKNRMRQAAKWKALVGLGVAVAAATLARPAESADHRDAPATSADAASDINDVYAFNDGTNVVLAMTVFPLANLAASPAKFSDATKYVFHTSSGSAFGTTTKDVDVICTFATDQKVQCWVGTDDYVPPGDASATAGISSASGKVKVFAGMRADPFFFNLCGFREAVGEVDTAEGPPSTLPAPDAAGCPVFTGGAANPVVVALQTSLKKSGPTNDLGPSSDPVTGYCKGASRTGPDDFTGFNTLALVVSVDKTLLTKGGPIMSVWAGTNK